MSDPQKYRTKEEVEQFKERDSIAALAHHLMNERGSLTEDSYKSMQTEIRDIVRDAVKFAEDSEAPDPAAELYSDVYTNPQAGLSPLREYVRGAKNPLL